MSLFRYVRLNIRTMICDHTFIFIMLILSATVTSLCLFFSYGLLCNTKEQIGIVESDRFYYEFSLKGSADLSSEIESFKAELGDELDRISVYANVKDINGEPHKVGFYSSLDGEDTFKVSSMLYKLVNDDKVIFDGVEYNAELSADVGSAALPLRTITDKAEVTSLNLYTDTQPTDTRVKEITRLAKELFGAECVIAPEARSLMNEQLNNTFYGYALVIVMIVVINLSMYIKYILKLRRRQIKILVICGAQRYQVILIQLAESVIEMLIGFIMAFAAYKLFILDIITKYYPHFTDYYNAKIYLRTFLIYLVGSSVVLLMTVEPYVSKMMISENGGVSDA